MSGEWPADHCLFSRHGLPKQNTCLLNSFYGLFHLVTCILFSVKVLIMAYFKDSEIENSSIRKLLKKLLCITEAFVHT